MLFTWLGPTAANWTSHSMQTKPCGADCEWENSLYTVNPLELSALASCTNFNTPNALRSLYNRDRSQIIAKTFVCSYFHNRWLFTEFLWMRRSTGGDRWWRRRSRPRGRPEQETASVWRSLEGRRGLKGEVTYRRITLTELQMGLLLPVEYPTLPGTSGPPWPWLRSHSLPSQLSWCSVVVDRSVSSYSRWDTIYPRRRSRQQVTPHLSRLRE